MTDAVKIVDGVRKWLQDNIAPELQVIKVEVSHNTQAIADLKQDTRQAMKDLEARQDKRFDAVDKRFDHVAGRFDAVAKDINGVRLEMQERFDVAGENIDNRFEAMGKDMKDRFDVIGQEIKEARIELLKAINQSEQRLLLTFENERLKQEVRRLRQYEPVATQPEKQ